MVIHFPFYIPLLPFSPSHALGAYLRTQVIGKLPLIPLSSARLHSATLRYVSWRSPSCEGLAAPPDHCDSGDEEGDPDRLMTSTVSSWGDELLGSGLKILIRRLMTDKYYCILFGARMCPLNPAS